MTESEENTLQRDEGLGPACGPRRCSVEGSSAKCSGSRCSRAPGQPWPPLAFWTRGPDGLGPAVQTLPVGVWGGLTVAILVASALVSGRCRPAPSAEGTADLAPDPITSFVTGSGDGIAQHEWTWSGGEALGTDVSHWATHGAHFYLVASHTRDAVTRDQTVAHADGRVERRAMTQSLNEVNS